MECFFSSFSNLKGQDIRLLGRSCLVFEGVQIKASNEKNYLQEKLVVPIDEPETFTIHSYNGSKGVSTHTLAVDGTKIIYLIMTCSLSSRVLKCSAIQVTGT